MLEKKEKLPVVAFTFSRRKCDDNADQLSNLNLTTPLEKSKTQVLMQKYLARLKGGDKTLPQVIITSYCCCSKFVGLFGYLVGFYLSGYFSFLLLFSPTCF
jgi:superfamily II RNA helicase